MTRGPSARLKAVLPVELPRPRDPSRSTFCRDLRPDRGSADARGAGVDAKGVVARGPDVWRFVRHLPRALEDRVDLFRQPPHHPPAGRGAAHGGTNVHQRGNSAAHRREPSARGDWLLNRQCARHPGRRPDGADPRVHELLDPVIQFFRFLSPTAIIPIAVIWFGIGEASKYFLIFWGSFFVILINTIHGVMATPHIRLRAAECLGATRLQIFTLIVLPTAVPSVLTGMRVALALSYMSIIPGEILAADKYGPGLSAPAVESPPPDQSRFRGARRIRHPRRPVGLAVSRCQHTSARQVSRCGIVALIRARRLVPLIPPTQPLVSSEGGAFRETERERLLDHRQTLSLENANHYAGGRIHEDHLTLRHRVDRAVHSWQLREHSLRNWLYLFQCDRPSGSRRPLLQSRRERASLRPSRLFRRSRPRMDFRCSSVRFLSL